MGTHPVIWESGEGEFAGSATSLFRFLVQSPGFDVAITDATLPPDFPGPVMHQHAAMTDICYVLEGALPVRLAVETRMRSAGGFAAVPPGVTHSFANISGNPVRFLNIFSPSGLEQYMKAITNRAAQGSAVTPEEMRQLALAYDFVPASTVETIEHPATK